MITINGTNVTIMTRNMDGAIAFYEQIGFALMQRWGNHYAMMTTTGLTIGLHPMAENAEPQGSGSLSIGLMVNELSEAKALLDGLSIAYNAEEDGKSGKYAHFKDQDGTALYFVQPGW